MMRRLMPGDATCEDITTRVWAFSFLVETIELAAGMNKGNKHA
jgi:hypothetical protein